MSPGPPPVLETERLVLRRLTLADAAFVRGLLNEPSFLRFIGDRGVRTLEEARAYLRDGPLASYDRHGFGLYLVVRRADGAPVGTCGLLRREGLDDVDIGYALRPAYWGQGYAFEAARAVLAYGHGPLGLGRIVAVVSPGNTASTGLLERLGLRFERRVRLSAGEAPLCLYATAG